MVKGHAKVSLHLMFGDITLLSDQLEVIKMLSSNYHNGDSRGSLPQ
jgi:hypothetical protein